MDGRMITFGCLLVWMVLALSADTQPFQSAEPAGQADGSDAISLIPTSIKRTHLELTVDGRTIELAVQYAVKEFVKDRPVLFVLPVWIAGQVERVIGQERKLLSPHDPLIPPDEDRPVQLNVTVRNLLDKPATEKLILDQLQSYVARLSGLGEPNFRIEKPYLKESSVRFTLIGRGRGEEPEIALSNAVPVADGWLGFDLDTAAVRRCERLHGHSAGLAVGNCTILATGPMKVRFERLELEAQMRYLQLQMADLRKRVGSSVNPYGPPPDVIVPFLSGGRSGRGQKPDYLDVAAVASRYRQHSPGGRRTAPFACAREGNREPHPPKRD